MILRVRLRNTSAKFKMAHFSGFSKSRNNTFRPRFPSFQGHPRSNMTYPPPLICGPPPRIPFPSQDFLIGGGPIQQTRPLSQPSRPSSQNSPTSRHFRGSEAAQRFPNAKEKLHNILQGALKGNSLSFSNKQVDFNFWQSTVNIPWPRPMSFYGDGSSKREAEKNAAALACVELEKLGVASIGAASILKREAVENKDEPRWIYIDDEQLAKLESFLLKHSVLSQQLYGPINQPQILQYQPAQEAQQSPAPINEIAFPEGSTESCSQSTSTDMEEFWKDSEIVKEHDFSDGETFPAQNTSESFIKKETQHSAVSCTPISPVIKDVFSGSPWKPLSVEQHKELSQQLLQEFSNKRNLLESRNSCLNVETKTLPIASHREKILELIERNQVVVISGETGCGKTTQIPQFILDDAIQKGSGSACNITVTQPRRIVAMSIAERVASERGEMLGKSVGYQVRLEGRLPSQKGCILFCTTGILLRKMQSNVLLKGVSHVIVDEVHERDINTDFLLILLKDLLEKNQDVKIIVMSATVNSERFSQYFRGCPSLVIPGFTHDVTEYFLSEVFEVLGRTPLSKPETVKSKRFKPDCSCSQVATRNLLSSHMNKKELSSTTPVTQSPSSTVLSGSHFKAWCYNPGVVKTVAVPANLQGFLYSSCWSWGVELQTSRDSDSPEADAQLIIETILFVSKNYPEGAILCFLAGWDEIIVVHDMLLSRISNKSQFLVLPLHSMLSMFNQRAVFERPPVGVRKIVLATNIAETSITIDDIVYVINAGNHKEKIYDTGKKVSCLMTHWTSQASVVQRRGRAGRCQPGFCFNLFSRQRFEHMAQYQSPEMQRVSLEEIVLQTKTQSVDESCSVRQFLSKALDPPSPFAVHNAITLLQEIGAMDTKEELTPLGRHMAHLPVEPRIAKMIIYGAIFRCLDPVLTIAAGLNYKDPFVSPLNLREQADQSRKSFAGDSRSDHVALLNAYNGWLEAVSRSQGKQFAQQRFLHWGTLNMIRGTRDQFSRLLHDSDLVPSFSSNDAVNYFSGNMELVKAILCAGLFPNAVKVGLALESKGRGGKKRVRIGFRTKSDGRVVLHPSSVNSDEKQFLSQWLVYHDKVKSSQVFIRDSSMVHPVALICFSGKDVHEIHQEHGPSVQQPRVTLAVGGDQWMAFYCSPRLARVLQAIRLEINKMVACSVSAAVTNNALFYYYGKLMETVAFLLTLPVQKPLSSSPW